MELFSRQQPSLPEAIYFTDGSFFIQPHLMWRNRRPSPSKKYTGA